MNAPGRITLTPNENDVRKFCDAVFAGATGFAPVRLLPEKGDGHAHPVTPFERLGVDLADRMLRHVEIAAARGLAACAVPGTVARPGRAGSADIAELTCATVDLDEGDVGAARDHLIRHLGQPALVVASGGVTDAGEDRLHLHWTLREPASGSAIRRLCSLRHEMAIKVGGDRSFRSAHQPVRIPGSIHAKGGVLRPVRILASEDRRIALEALSAAVGAMPALPSIRASHRREAPHRPKPREVATKRVRAGGIDGVTRHEAMTLVMGSLIQKARIGLITLREARVAAHAHNAGFVAPSWPEERVDREFARLAALDRKNHPMVANKRGSGEMQNLASPAPSEDELAERFTVEFSRTLRFCATLGGWMRWDGAVWTPDETSSALHLARLVCRDAARGTNAGGSRRIASAATASAVERLARSDPRHAVASTVWDADPWLLNTRDGVVDLRDGTIRAHDPDLLMTKMVQAGIGEAAPLWARFLQRVTDGDNEFQAYLARVAGSCLTGSTRDQKVFFIHGPGGNGKSVFLRALGEILGGYAVAAPLDAFLASPGDRHPTDIADFRGARLVTVAETEAGRRWAETRLKMLSGGDAVRARHLYQDFFEYVPQFKLIVAGNHKPEFREGGEAVRRRIQLIPFGVTIPECERNLDLVERLLEERDGILGWMLRGCADWLKIGLATPAAIRRATEAYFRDEDRLQRWIDECCDLEPRASEAVGALYASFRSWSEDAGEPVVSKKTFSQALAAKGFERGRSSDRRVIGLSLRPPVNDAEDPT